MKEEYFTQFSLKLLKLGGLHPTNPYCMLDKIKILLAFSANLILIALTFLGFYFEKDNVKIIIKLMESALTFSHVTFDKIVIIMLKNRKSVLGSL